MPTMVNPVSRLGGELADCFWRCELCGLEVRGDWFLFFITTSVDRTCFLLIIALSGPHHEEIRIDASQSKISAMANSAQLMEIISERIANLRKSINCSFVVTGEFIRNVIYDDKSI